MHRAFYQRHLFPVAILVCVTSFFSGYAIAQIGVIYGVRDLGNSYRVHSLDLADYAITSDLLTGNQSTEERIQSLFHMPNGRLALLRTNVTRNANNRSNIEIIGNPGGSLRQHPTNTTRVRGLSATQAISIASRPDHGNTQSLTAIISHFSDTPPFSVGTIDLTTGQMAILPLQVPEHTRLSNLTQCPDGFYYAISLGVRGGARLVQMKLESETYVELVKLTFDGKTLYKDLKSLTCSPDNELFALGDPDYSGTNTLFQIDPVNGELVFIRTFNVDLITF